MSQTSAPLKKLIKSPRTPSPTPSEIWRVCKIQTQFNTITIRALYLHKASSWISLSLSPHRAVNFQIPQRSWVWQWNNGIASSGLGERVCPSLGHAVGLLSLLAAPGVIGGDEHWLLRETQALRGGGPPGTCNPDWEALTLTFWLRGAAPCGLPTKESPIVL